MTAATFGPFESAANVLRQAIAARAFPGCSFGVWADRGIVLRGALGRFTYDPGSEAVVSDTIYDVASITKVAATTATAMLLHQRGQIDLETPLGDLLPGFVIGRTAGQRTYSRQITLRHLLAHNSGLPGYVELFRSAHTPAAFYRALLQLPIEAAPGARAEYSDPGFILLGKALEVLIREPLHTFAVRELYRPLGMTSTTFCPALARRLSIPPTELDTTFRDRLIQGEVQDENASILQGVAGHAGLFSNVPDLLRFAAAIFAAEASATSLFTKPTLDLFAQRQPPAGSSRALGWDTPSQPSSSGTHFSPRSIGHLGYSGCSLWIDLDAGIAIALLTNRTWPTRAAEAAQLIKQVRPAFHDAVRVALGNSSS